MVNAFNFKNTYTQLPSDFYEKIVPVPVQKPELFAFNEALAKTLQLGFLNDNRQLATKIFSGNSIPHGAEPIAQAYAGHQFGNFVPQLGDGRAILLGEVIDKNQQRQDIQLKGSGKTHYSRGGDGRAPLGAVVREYIVSHAMDALGIPTTKSLAIVGTGEWVQRDTLLPGGVLTRVASSHIRIGTFEFFAARQNEAAIKTLADYTIERHYPELKTHNQPYLELLRSVMKRQCELVSCWLGVGFIHGVMNTDNMTLSGETIDYGPCAFLDSYHPETKFSSIDTYGRYAYGNQRNITGWNLACLAQTLLPLMAPTEQQALEQAQHTMNTFYDTFDQEWLNVMAAKIGVKSPKTEDSKLINDFLSLIQHNRADFTNAFAALNAAFEVKPIALEPYIGHSDLALQWFHAWQNRLNEAAKQTDINTVTSTLQYANPVYIARNHQVEKAIIAAEKDYNFEVMNTLLAVLKNPFQHKPEWQGYTNPPNTHERVHQTFCGT